LSVHISEDFTPSGIVGAIGTFNGDFYFTGFCLIGDCTLIGDFALTGYCLIGVETLIGESALTGYFSIGVFTFTGDLISIGLGAIEKDSF
jgi:hypothetical protein